jgi:hypothetical protein
MAKQHFRIIRDNYGAPIACACTQCNWQFEVSAGELWGQARDYLIRKFGEHKCASEDTTAGTARTVIKDAEAT